MGGRRGIFPFVDLFFLGQSPRGELDGVEAAGRGREIYHLSAPGSVQPRFNRSSVRSSWAGALLLRSRGDVQRVIPGFRCFVVVVAAAAYVYKGVSREVTEQGWKHRGRGRDPLLARAKA